jgi:hypothetical protein
MKYFIRRKKDMNGNITEVKIPVREAMKEINEMIKKDREMLKILEKL